MRNFLLVVILAVGVVAVSSLPRNTSSVAADTQHSTAVFDSDGKLKLPTGYRRWVFVGAPLTPDGLNNGKAGFPEYHHVYVEEKIARDLRTPTAGASSTSGIIPCRTPSQLKKLRRSNVRAATPRLSPKPT